MKPIRALLALTLVSASAEAATSLDYDVWRRTMLDICQRMPTMEELACVAVDWGSGCALTREAQISECINHREFADLIGLWVDDFLLPEGKPGITLFHWLTIGKASVETAAGSEVIRYWYSHRGGWVDCLTPCGNGVLDSGEACDDGNNVAGDGCDAACGTESPAECGNGVLEAGEDCDDQNTTTGDGCHECAFEVASVCGNGVLEPGEECDDGNVDPDDSCSLGCRRNHVSQNDITMRLEKVHDAFWLAGVTAADANRGIYDDNDGLGPYVYLCRQPHEGAIRSLSNEEVELDSGRRCDAGDPTFPCGCGPGLRWCLLESALFPRQASTGAFYSAATPGNADGRTRLFAQLRAEGRAFVREVVHAEDDVLGSDATGNFMQLFTADFAIRTSRLQHFYEVLQANHVDPPAPPVDFDVVDEDGCTRLIAGTADKSKCPSVPIPSAVVYRDRTEEAPSTDWTSVEMPGVTPGTTTTVVPDAEYGDWQKIEFSHPTGGSSPFDYRSAGLLTTWLLLHRQPTEPNYANRIYTFWTCQDVSWRHGWTMSPHETIPDAMVLNQGDGDVFVSTLARGAEANETWNMDACKGCHTTVNPLGAFRNEWDSSGRFMPLGDHGARGVFLGMVGEGLAGTATESGLGELLANSRLVHACVANRSYRQLVGEFLPLNDARLQELTDVFVDEVDPAVHDPDYVTLAGEHDGPFNIKRLYLYILNLPEYRRPR